MTTGSLEGRKVKDPEFLLALRDRHRAITWATEDVRSIYRDPQHYAYTRRVAESAYRRALDDARVRACYRAYKRVVAEEGSHAAARVRIAFYACLGLLCVAGFLTVAGWIHGTH